MFTANSMNCLTEALGLSLPGNGTIVATHADREQLFLRAGRLIVELAKRHYEQDDYLLPRSIATKARSKTPWRWTSPWAVRPTPCCTCWPRRTKPVWTSHGRHRPHLARCPACARWRR
jgi:hypothetical protein